MTKIDSRRCPVRRLAPRLFKFTRSYWFRSKLVGLIIIPKGYVTDFASVPRIFWTVYPPDGEYAEAAVFHDWLYSLSYLYGKFIPRKLADAVFLEVMEEIGIPFHRRHILHKAVRSGGWTSYGKSNKLRSYNQQLFFPDFIADQ